MNWASTGAAGWVGTHAGGAAGTVLGVPGAVLIGAPVAAGTFVVAEVISLGFEANRISKGERYDVTVRYDKAEKLISYEITRDGRRVTLDEIKVKYGAPSKVETRSVYAKPAYSEPARAESEASLKKRWRRAQRR